MSNADKRLTAALLFAVVIGLAWPSTARAEAELDRSQMPKTEGEYTEAFGVDLYHRGLYPEAIAVWQHAFETQQNAGAAYELGTVYLDANVVEKDVPLALDYLRASALRGDVRAMFELGSVYDNGEHTARDLTQASIWYYMGAMRDDPGAEFNLANLYEAGVGVEANPVMAHAYYTLAISHGFPDPADVALRALSAKMTLAQRNQATRLAKHIQASRATSASHRAADLAETR